MHAAPPPSAVHAMTVAQPIPASDAPVEAAPHADAAARARAFLDEHGPALERRLLAEGWTAVEPELDALRGRVRDAGLWAPPLPRAWGGMGLPLPEFARVSEELGRWIFGHYAFGVQAPDMGNMELLLSHGTDAQRERWLRPLAAGQVRSCFAMTEPEHAGSNPVVLSTAAVRDGGEYLLRGHKWFTSS